ncbi:glycosyltransferase family 39 protein [Granulicella sp. S156]|uniref:ArnT family glycosyltransferase n=1 Tax=Granulicella sp. S156 TaxID=1747224 RepID=UPI0020B110AB|nr:phospholipid carrier-dependent glycosyltransferase [Granulicella sp. S156]
MPFSSQENGANTVSPGYTFRRNAVAPQLTLEAMLQVTPRPRSTLFSVLLLWLAFYASFTLFAPPLLDDADSVHAEVAREMLLRHDYVTLYANGIRYLEKAPLLYWSMAASMKVFGVSAAAARLPLALAMLALALLLEAFARRLLHSARAGLYAALILLSSFGIFIFTRITIPDAGVCLWISLALYCFWRTEELEATHAQPLRLFCGGFAAACALNVLTKGLIGVVFPVGIVLVYLLLTRGVRRTLRRLRELHPWASLEAFLLIAAPWHILAGLANPTQGHPTPFHFVNGHWQVPLPTDGNVRGWFWFYFMNEHVLRYLNLRVPHDYDTAPLWLFWGLCFVWMMPWSAFVFKAAEWALPWRNDKWRSQLRRHDLPLRRRGLLLCTVWAAFVLLFFSLSTRQEYYVLPALPAVAMLIAGWLAYQMPTKPEAQAHRRSANRCLAALLVLGAIFSSASVYFLFHTKAPAPNTDLAQLLQQNPGDYALSMGHFLDLNTQALGLFRIPLALAALSLFLGPLVALLLHKKSKFHSANLALTGGAFGFLLAAHLGLQTFAPVIGSAELAKAIAPQVRSQDMIAIHGEYESGSTLGFYLKRDDLHILEGRSSNLWYGSFFPDAPPIFETPQSIAQKWTGSQRIFLWQSLTDEPRNLPALPGPVYILVKNGGKEIVSNQPNR